MAYWGATVAGVLAKVQNTNTDVDQVGGTAYVEGLMTDAEKEIISGMPDRNSDPIDVGEIEGHILVRSANEDQDAIDATQTIPQVASNYHIFINYSGCGIPPNNQGYEAVLGTDYTIESDIPDFAIKPLSLGAQVIANYYTTWSDNYGLELLKSILEEQVALIISDNVGLSDNPEFQAGIIDRRNRNEAKKMKLIDGSLVPQGVQQMRLVVENSVNDESRTATVTRFRRG